MIYAFPDVESALITYLKSEGIEARGQVLNIGTPQVTLKLTGGYRKDPRRVVAQVTFSSWGKTPNGWVEAFELGSKVLQLIENLPLRVYVGNYPIHQVSIVTPLYVDPDPFSETARYSCTLQITLAGVK